jgi:hypothetical protein
MKELKLTIHINKTPHEVFEFTINPKNTSLWIDSIVKEETNEWPVKLGSTYRNQGKEGKWNEYVVTGFEKDKTFTLSQKGSTYHVRYTFTSVGDDSCKLEYYEWVDDGKLLEPFTMDILMKLKEVVER